jgi:glycosyltransferase involved in cell wall biosynthesis
MNMVKEINPDVIHTSTYRPTYYSTKYLSNYFRIATLSSNLEPNYKKHYGDFLGGWIAKRELKAFCKANIKTVVSFTLAKIYGKIEGLKVIQNGADEQKFFDPDFELKIKLRKTFNLQFDSKIFISIGALTPLKDPKTLVQAFLQSDLTSNQTLLILGEGPEKAELEKIIDNHPQIKLLGYKNNPEEYLQASDVFVSGSHSEGLPNTVVEAASCGLFCILSDIPQHHEIFDEDNQRASFFYCSNIPELSKLFNQNHEGYSNSKFHLTAKKMANDYMDLYDLASIQN